LFILYNFIWAVAQLLDTLLNVYVWIVIAAVVLSWVNPDPYNPIVRFVRSATEPVLSRARRAMPFLYVSGIDLSPMLVVIGIYFVKQVVVMSLYQVAGRMRTVDTGFGIH
jgi:YggT family protein